MKGKKAITNLIAIAGVILLGFIIFKSGIFNNQNNDDYKNYMSQKEKEINQLEKSNLMTKIEEYGALKGLKGPQQAPSTGKVFVVVNNLYKEKGPDGIVGKYKYSSSYFQLPKELRANSTEELNILVQLNTSYKQTNSYTGGKPAYTNYVVVKILAMPSGKTIGEKTLIGTPPFSIKETASEGSGFVGDAEIVKCIMETCGYKTNQ